MRKKDFREYNPKEKFRKANDDLQSIPYSIKNIDNSIDSITEFLDLSLTLKSKRILIENSSLFSTLFSKNE